jgi:hypothetical protein
MDFMGPSSEGIEYGKVRMGERGRVSKGVEETERLRVKKVGSSRKREERRIR